MPKTFVIGCKMFFGLKSDQTLAQFAKEVRRLSEDDRNEMAPLLTEALGEEVTSQLSK